MRIKQPIERKLIPANKDPKYMIKEDDAGVYSVLCTRITILPSDPFHPLRQSFVQTFDPATWRRFQELATGPHPVDWKKAALIAEARVIHDPTIIKK